MDKWMVGDDSNGPLFVLLMRIRQYVEFPGFCSALQGAKLGMKICMALADTQ